MPLRAPICSCAFEWTEIAFNILYRYVTTTGYNLMVKLISLPVIHRSSPCDKVLGQLILNGVVQHFLNVVIKPTADR